MEATTLSMGGHELNGALSLVEEDVQADAQLSLTVPTLSEAAFITGSVEVSGAGWSKANGVYIPCEPSASKQGRTWRKQDGPDEWWIGHTRNTSWCISNEPGYDSRPGSGRYMADYSPSAPRDGLWPAREGWKAYHVRPPSGDAIIVTPMAGLPKNFSDDLEAFRAGVRAGNIKTP